MDPSEEEVFDDGEAAQHEEGEGEDGGFDEDELDSALADVQGGGGGQLRAARAACLG